VEKKNARFVINSQGPFVGSTDLGGLNKEQGTGVMEQDFRESEHVCGKT
jgi:hypothetical protein